MEVGRLTVMVMYSQRGTTPVPRLGSIFQGSIVGRVTERGREKT
jgi:hypothetical protein